MINRPIHWNIKGKDANIVLKDANVNIPIYSSNYEDIFIDRDIITALSDNLDRMHKIFYSEDKELSDSLIREIHLDYMPDNDTYYIGFDYEKMFKNILSKLAVNDDLIKKLKLPSKIQSEKDYYKCFYEIERIIYSEKQLREKYPVEVPNTILTDDILTRILNYLGTILKDLQTINNLIENATKTQLKEEQEFSDRKKDIAIKNHNYISWKNLMLYTSIEALHMFDKNKDIKYYRYAKNYYSNVSKERNGSYPKGMIIDGKYYHCDFSDYNVEFLNIRKNNFPEILTRLDIEDKDFISIRPNKKRGNSLKGTIKYGIVTSKKIDYTKINPSLGRKITYYKGLAGKTQGIIKFVNDKDYIGYVLDNNYVVFDKFYEVSRDNKAKPASKGALYIVSLDVLDKCNYDRKKLKEYIDKNHDNKAFRYIHNDNDSYKERLDEALNLRDRSRIKYKGLKLKIENKNN